MKQALICFLKYPTPGEVKTRLAEHLGDDAATEFYQLLVERVITEVFPAGGGYDLLLYVTETKSLEAYRAWLGESWRFHFQEGGDLGERMANAFRETLESGYEKVAVIGTDCINMDELFIEEMFAGLDTHDLVIGPSTDGGYYLMASNEPNPWLFDDIEWSGPTVLEATLDRVEARELKHQLLEPKIDIDTLDDLVDFRRTLPEEHFLAKKIDQLVSNRLSGSNGPPEADA